MPHTEVTEIELRDDDSIVLTIEVFGFDAGTRVEISGSATQANGAIATFYDIQNLPNAEPDGGSFLTVTAAPSTDFLPGEVISVVGRAAKIWGTVLSRDPGDQRPGIKAVWKAKPGALCKTPRSQVSDLRGCLRETRFRISLQRPSSSLLITAAKNISPAGIEGVVLAASPLIAHVVAVGGGPQKSGPCRP